MHAITSSTRDPMLYPGVPSRAIGFLQAQQTCVAWCAGDRYVSFSARRQHPAYKSRLLATREVNMSGAPGNSHLLLACRPRLSNCASLRHDVLSSDCSISARCTCDRLRRHPFGFLPRQEGLAVRLGRAVVITGTEIVAELGNSRTQLLFQGCDVPRERS